MATAQVLALAVAPLAAYLVWRRFTPAPVALGIAALTFAGYADPSKPYEIVALAVLLPWLLVTVADPPRGRLGAVPAGVIGGLMLLTYQGFLVFAALGLIALAWRACRSRPRQLARLAVVAVTAVAVAAGYLGPYLWAVATRETHLAADTYQSPAYAAGFPLPVLAASPTGLAQLAGLIGLVCLLGSAWWARPVLTVLIGVYAFIVLGWLRWALTGHNMFVHYAGRLVATLLIAAAVLTAWEVITRYRSEALRRAVVLVAVAVIAAQAVAQWRVWYPTTVGGAAGARLATLDGGTMADVAHREPLPDGRLPRWAPGGGLANWLAVERVRAEVTARLGPRARPTLLTVDERVFAFLPWYQYLPKVAATAPTLAQFGAREAQVRALAAQPDPALFAAQAAATPFGRIDAFLLNSSPEGGLWWRDVSFRAAQFDRFDRVDLPNGFVLFVARPEQR
jgi:hypothetical protein